ncbi:unnamed protein product [Caenorhabditis bovis]|uniref:Uncharacterized protein n=1 Tax=Caenorhabditis bovis TaxID=2654633 RepID=A0A8S1F9H7_9PELO|nr:unnamed protein product [Caenorhabditis bovis]
MDINVENDVVVCGAASKSARIIAIDEQTGKMAVIRKQRKQGAHDYIEFYNVLTGWLATRELVVCPENGSIEHAMFVANGELLVSHANGSICFVDPHDSRRVKRIQIAASTIWAACEHSNNVALISHSSILFIFDVVNKLIVSSVSLGVDSRLFDVSSNGNLVAIGAIDGIMIAGDGKVQRTLVLDRENRRDPTIAWSVRFWKSDVLACGDSRGTVTLWNPESGALIQAIKCMQSHILTMCIVNDELNVAGVDPRITSIKKLATNEYDVVRRRTGPIRDVRSLASYDGRVYASGEDFDIFVGKDGCRPLVQQWKTNIEIGGEIVASCGENFVDVWWKQTGDDEPTRGSDFVPQHFKSVFLAKIFSPKQTIITCWSLSRCGKQLAIGTAKNVSIYSILPETRRKIAKIATFDDVAPTALHISEKVLTVCRGDFEILQFQCAQENKKPRIVIDQSECGSVVKLDVSRCGQLAAVLTTRCQVFLVNVANGQSRVVKVDLPIDVIARKESAVILCTHPAFAENSDQKKVVYEVAATNASILKSASSLALRMTPTSPKSFMPGLPIGLCRLRGDRFATYSYDGHFSLVDLENQKVFTPPDAPTTAKHAVNGGMMENGGVFVFGARQIEKEEKVDRIVVLRIAGDEEPKVDGFRLKKFGMQ